MSTCEKHEEIREQLRDHEKRIVALEKADAYRPVGIRQ